jgi:hypothetical protein
VADLLASKVIESSSASGDDIGAGVAGRVVSAWCPSGDATP